MEFSGYNYTEFVYRLQIPPCVFWWKVDGPFHLGFIILVDSSGRLVDSVYVAKKLKWGKTEKWEVKKKNIVLRHSLRIFFIALLCHGEYKILAAAF